jgi:hypothetical protein
MNTRLWRWVLTGLIYSGLIFALSGCTTTIPVHQTEVRNLPDEVRIKLSRGDSQKKVRSVLGIPLVDSQSIGVEVYVQSGWDIMWTYIGPPLLVPGLGEKLSAFTLVAYDENGIVKDIATDLWIHPGVGDIGGDDFSITAGGFSFVNTRRHKPETLLGPPISWKELAGMAAPEGSCSLVLLMGNCPMDQVLLDASLIADFTPAGLFVCYEESLGVKNHLLGAFFHKTISTGIHHLNILQKSLVPDADFEADFECASGETIYAELEGVYYVPDSLIGHFEGAITIRKSIPNNAVKMDRLQPIIWHKGTWYDAPNITGAYGQ